MTQPISQIANAPGVTQITATLDGKVTLTHDGFMLKMDANGARTAASMMNAAAIKVDQINSLIKQMPVGMTEEQQIAWLSKQFEDHTSAVLGQPGAGIK